MLKRIFEAELNSDQEAKDFLFKKISQLIEATKDVDILRDDDVRVFGDDGPRMIDILWAEYRALVILFCAAHGNLIALYYQVPEFEEKVEGYFDTEQDLCARVSEIWVSFPEEFDPVFIHKFIAKICWIGTETKHYEGWED